MDLKQYLIDEFVEDYKQGEISRRKAFKLLTGIVGAASAASLLSACGTPAVAQEPTPEPRPNVPRLVPTPAPAATAPPAPPEPAPNSVPEGDARVVAEMVSFAQGDATVMGYMTRPAAEGVYPIVLVCHENRGLTPHIQDVARRVAVAGYVGLAVDLVSREGGTANTPADSIPGILSNAPAERHIGDFVAGLEYARTMPYTNSARVGMVGFCFGGGVTWRVAANVPDMSAAVPFYGPPVPVEQVPQINAPVRAIYAERDERINTSIPAIEEAMAANGKIFEKFIYPGVDHAFHNDTGQRYNAPAAQDAWAKTLEWFERYLRA